VSDRTRVAGLGRSADGHLQCAAVSDRAERPFNLLYMFHPTAYVLSLDDTDAWFEKVFHLPSERLNTAPQDPNNRMDYSTFTMIRDVLIDSLNPHIFIRDGQQVYESVSEPHLKTTGWYVDDVPAVYDALRREGIAMVGRFGEPLTTAEARDTLKEPPAMFFTVADDIGIKYQFFGPMPLKFDPRMQPGWQLGPRRADDPFGIEMASHHTVLTDRPERALRLFVNAMGGSIIHEGRNEALGTRSTYVRVSDGIFELGIPDEGTPAHDDWKATAPRDCYHAITFRVHDLDQVRSHLASVGVSVRNDTGSYLVTDPATSQGIPWGFTLDAVPGDDRA
jgi:hypothetical protein